MKTIWGFVTKISLFFTFILMLLNSSSSQASNLNQFFQSSGTMTGAINAVACTATTYNQLRVNISNHQLEYCNPNTNTWTAVQTNPVASVQFTLTNVTNAVLNTLTTSATVNTVGSGTGAITITGGSGSPQLSVAGGPWATSDVITAGQTLAVRMTSSSSPSTTNTATITVGGLSATWTVTTEVACVPGSTTLTYVGSIINFTRPTGCSTLTIEAWGAKGSYGTSYTVESGGLGAYIKGTITTTPGTVYKALVGQKGGPGGAYQGGGGGGSFVTTSANAPVIIAGGGGGASMATVGQPGQITTTGGAGSAAGGTGGSGGTAASGSHSSAGLTGNGVASSCGMAAGTLAQAFVNGGAGGAGGTCAAAGGYGGFGGGSGGEHCCQGASGAGGGYSGGGGANASVSGGGGGSYVSGTGQVTTSGVDAGQSGNGKIIFTYAQ